MVVVLTQLAARFFCWVALQVLLYDCITWQNPTVQPQPRLAEWQPCSTRLGVTVSVFGVTPFKQQCCTVLTLPLCPQGGGWACHAVWCGVVQVTRAEALVSVLYVCH